MKNLTTCLLYYFVRNCLWYFYLSNISNSHLSVLEAFQVPPPLFGAENFEVPPPPQITIPPPPSPLVIYERSLSILVKRQHAFAERQNFENEISLLPGCQRNGLRLLALNLSCCENWDWAEKAKSCQIVGRYQYDGILNQILWTNKVGKPSYLNFMMEIFVCRTTQVDNQT